MTAIVQVGDAIEVARKRDRRADSDPILAGIESELKSMVDLLSNERAMYEVAAVVDD